MDSRSSLYSPFLRELLQGPTLHVALALFGFLGKGSCLEDGRFLEEAFPAECAWMLCEVCWRIGQCELPRFSRPCCGSQVLLFEMMEGQPPYYSRDRASF